MRDAVKIHLEYANIIERDGASGILVRTMAFSQELQKRGRKTPSATAAKDEDRFRAYLVIKDNASLNKVYYVAGYFDEGYVHMGLDSEQGHIEPDRRAAVAATRNKVS